MLTLDDVQVRYGGSHILQGIYFAVPATGVTALLGRNGVGKTTTLKAILGLAPATGRILFDGQRDRGHDDRIASSVGGIGYVPEDREVFARSHGRGEPAGSLSPTGRRRRLRHGARALPRTRRAAQAARRDAVRWSAADGGAGPGAAAARTRCCWSTNRRRAWRPSSSPRSATCWPGWRETDHRAAGRAEPATGAADRRPRHRHRHRPGRAPPATAADLAGRRRSDA